MNLLEEVRQPNPDQIHGPKREGRTSRLLVILQGFTKPLLYLIRLPVIGSSAEDFRVVFIALLV